MSGNQYIPDPRQSLFLQHYLDPKSETFSNAFQSAIKAGYTKEYAEVILSKDLDWLSEGVRYADIVKKAEKNLEEFMSIEDNKIRSDMTKFALERLKKDKFSTRSELTGGGGKDLPTPLLIGITNVPNDNSPEETDKTK